MISTSRLRSLRPDSASQGLHSRRVGPIIQCPGVQAHRLSHFIARGIAPLPDFSMRSALLLVALAPVCLQAQTLRDSIISVSVSRTAHVAADRVALYVVIEGTAETAPDAVARVETKIKAVAEAIKAFMPRVESDRPIAYTVGPTPAPAGFPGTASPFSSLARSVIHVQLSRPEDIARLVAVALAAGASSTSTYTFESSVADSVRRARIGEAMTVARADAELMARALGGQLGTVTDATSTAVVGFTQPPTLNLDTRFPTQSPTPEVVVTASVTVRYRLVR